MLALFLQQTRSPLCSLSVPEAATEELTPSAMNQLADSPAEDPDGHSHSNVSIGTLPLAELYFDSAQFALFAPFRHQIASELAKRIGPPVAGLALFEVKYPVNPPLNALDGLLNALTPDQLLFDNSSALALEQPGPLHDCMKI